MYKLPISYLIRVLKPLCKNLFIVLIISGVLSSCNETHKKSGFPTHFDSTDFITIKMDIDEDYLESCLSHLGSPHYIVLKENDSVLLAEISKIIAKNNRFYILDSWETRSAVAFDQDGLPITRYGRIGQGPGEYVRPFDLWVKDSVVYILDANQKKIIKYQEDGKYISEIQIPFFADAFAVLPDNGFMFAIHPDGKETPRICVTDSSANNPKYMLNAQKGYVGGLLGSNIFRETSQGISFYTTPLDSMYFFDDEGNIMGGMLYDFNSKTVSDNTKLDFIAARENNSLIGKRWLSDQPILFSDTFLVASVTENNFYYNCLFNLNEGRLGGQKFGENGHPFILTELCTTDDAGNLIGYTLLEYIEDLDKKYQPDDSLMALLKDNQYMLVSFPLSK